MSGDIRSCAYCGDPFRPSRRWQRFCDTDCHDTYHAELSRMMRCVVQSVPLISVAAVSLTLG